MESGVSPTVSTMPVDFSRMTQTELMNFRRSLLGVLAMVERAMGMPLTSQPKGRRD